MIGQRVLSARHYSLLTIALKAIVFVRIVHASDEQYSFHIVNDRRKITKNSVRSATAHLSGLSEHSLITLGIAT
jgi:hypothetical protein